MKLSFFSLFRAKSDRETHEPRPTCDNLQQRLLSKRVQLIPLRSPGDQLQIVVLLLMGE
jgi:hypothetical protein